MRASLKKHEYIFMKEDVAVKEGGRVKRKKGQRKFALLEIANLNCSLFVPDQPFQP